MSYKIQDTIDYYLTQEAETLEISKIRKELKDSGFKEEEIREVVQAVDDYILENLNNQAKVNFEISSKTIGIVLIFFGLTITMLSFFFAVQGKIPVIIITYGPIISGLFLYIRPVGQKGALSRSRFRNRMKR